LFFPLIAGCAWVLGHSSKNLGAMAGDGDKNGAEAEAKAEEKADDVEMKDAKAEEAPKATEAEEDAPADSRPKVAADVVGINTADSTLNVLPVPESSMLMTLTDGGWQYLLAGARSTAGIKSGRYLFEVRIVETHTRPEAATAGPRMPTQRQLLRLGVTHRGGTLFLGDLSPEAACFDAEGFFMTRAAPRKKACPKFGRDAVVGLLVNLDAASPNANTLSLFLNGNRACEPQQIPEDMLGKPLFPTITYKNVSLQVNFGPAPLMPLPFKCNMLGSAATADVEVVSVPKPKDGKYNMILPVGLPDQGYFDWVDAFLEKHPDYTEISDRKIIEWITKSGVPRPKVGGSNDKPDMRFGVSALDDGSIRRVLCHLASSANRNFIVPELRLSLLKLERQSLLRRFALPKFRKVAHVIIGEPTAEHKAKVRESIIASKKEKVLQERRRKKAEVERQRQLEERKRKATEMVRKKQGLETEPAEDAKAPEPLAEDDEEIVVELTDEEKAMWYTKGQFPDIADAVLGKGYKDFTLPSTDEGFDDIAYDWQKEGDAAKIVSDWQFKMKLRQRVDDIKPGEWFTSQWPVWSKQIQEWRKRQTEWKDPAKRKALLEKRAEAKKKAVEEAKEKGDEAAAAEAGAEESDVNIDDVDPMAVADVSDVAKGEPLFASFAYEDWHLVTARAELFMLLHSFKKDVNDPDRPSFSGKDLAFYYQKYYKRVFSVKAFAADSVESVVAHMKDTLSIDESSTFLEVSLPEDTALEQFVKLAEAHRRDRQRRLDAGDESAELKFPRTPGAPGSAPAGPGGLRPGGYAAGNVGAHGGITPSVVPATKRPAPPAATSWVAKQPRAGFFGGKR